MQEWENRLQNQGIKISCVVILNVNMWKCYCVATRISAKVTNGLPGHNVLFILELLNWIDLIGNISINRWSCNEIEYLVFFCIYSIPYLLCVLFVIMIIFNIPASTAIKSTYKELSTAWMYWYWLSSVVTIYLDVVGSLYTTIGHCYRSK